MGLPQHEITTLAVCHDTELYHVIILPHNRVTPPLVGDRTLLAPYTDSRTLITPVLKHYTHLHTTNITHTYIHVQQTPHMDTTCTVLTHTQSHLLST